MSLFRLRRRRREGAVTSQEPDEVVAELLREADALAARGRATDAVELLTEANQRERDRRFEHRLVDLRWDAFQQARPPDRPPSWPTTVRDLTPGTAIPEVTRDELTAAQLRSGIWNHGCLRVRGLLDQDHVEEMTRDIDRAIAAYDSGEQVGDRRDLAGWYRPFAPDTISKRDVKRSRGSILTVESPPALFDLLEVFERVGLPGVVGDYFDERPAILARKATLRRVSPSPKIPGWHQDGAFMGAGIRSLNVWITLTDCGEDAPSLDLVARRVDEILPTGAGYAAWGLKADLVEELFADAIVRPNFQRGDALFFDHFSVHRTGMDKRMSRDRYALETWMFAPSTYAAMTAPSERGYSPRDQVPILF